MRLKNMFWGIASTNRSAKRIRDEGSDTQIEFLHTELFSFHADRPFDAVVGRYVLLYQPDPVAAIRHAAEQVRPEGIIVFHEMDMANRITCYPDRTLFAEIYALIAETFRRSGYWTDLGLQLTRLFLDAGLSWPTVKAAAPVGGEPGSFIYSLAHRDSSIHSPSYRGVWSQQR
jgi:ssDNA-specific exonuclease RecJ